MRVNTVRGEMSVYVKDEGGDWGGVLIWSKINIEQIWSEQCEHIKMQMLTKKCLLVQSVSPTSNIGFQISSYAWYTVLCSGQCTWHAVQASHVFTLQRVNIGSTGSIICMGKTDVLRCQVVTDSESLGVHVKYADKIV